MADRVSIAAFRFGYGLPARPEMASAEGLLAALAGPDEAAERWPSITVADLMPVIEEFLRIKKAGKAEADNARAKANLKDVAGVSDQLAVRGAKAALARAVGAEDPLRERLVQFWADHFTTVARNRIERALPATMIEEAIRPNLMRPFAEMLKAVVTHPAMLIYLNQASSVGPGSRLGMRQGKGLNENLARELLESHTLGVGAGYAQDDVRQMAELLTGLSLRPGTGFVFDPRQAEPGPETVLGVTYRGEGVAPIFRALEALAVRPETARHLAGKLAVHFVSDEPDAGLVSGLEAAWSDSGGDLAVAIWRSWCGTRRPGCRWRPRHGNRSILWWHRCALWAFRRMRLMEWKTAISTGRTCWRRARAWMWHRGPRAMVG